MALVVDPSDIRGCLHRDDATTRSKRESNVGQRPTIVNPERQIRVSKKAPITGVPLIFLHFSG
jgi:hypothetical protein